MKQSYPHNPSDLIENRHALNPGRECGLLASSQPTSLITINAPLNVRDATIPKR
jgi:hypothetical protein